MRHNYFLIGILIIITSCSGYTTEVKEALVLAGENRNELEQVLTYSKRKGDIAYKSACFLIENMKYHKSKNRINTDSTYHHYFANTDSLYQIIFGNMSLYEIQHHNGKGYDSIRKSLAKSFDNINKKTKTATQNNLTDL